jgi:hypothetical protein
MDVSSPKSRIIWEGEGNFPFDWIAPGEYRYCGCGHLLLPKGETVCAPCRYRPRLEDYVCACGKQAYIMDVNGFRCSEHRDKPYQDCVKDDKMTITFGRLRKDFNSHLEKQEASKAISDQLHAEREALATQRKAEGVKRLFWMQKD